MKKRIYFVRHGETSWNSSNLIQGKGINAPLNSHGEQQAKAFFEYYKHIPFDRIYTSSLLRTHQSMQPFTATGIPHEVLSGFDEMDFGVMEGKSMFDANGSFVLEPLFTRWRNGDGDAKVEGGESPNEVTARMKEALASVLSNKSDSTVIVCMHGRALKVLLCHLLNQPVSSMEKYNHHNLAVSIFDYDYDTAAFSPICIASTAHFEAQNVSR